MDNYYIQFLERPVDPSNAAEVAGVQQMVQQLQAGISDDVIVAEIVGSPSEEFYDRGTR